MTTLLLPTALAAALLLSTTIANTSLVRDETPAAQGDSLAQITTLNNGDTNYWTPVGNDTPYIKDHENAKKGSWLSLLAQNSKASEMLMSQVDRGIEVSVSEAPAQAPAYAATTQNTQPVVAQAVANGPRTLTDAQVNFLGNCEAGMDPAKNTGNGYYGAFQFSHGTWQRMNTGYARADLAPIEVQKAAVQQLLQRSSIYSQFPACANRMHNAGII